jgi:hypothetical protein
MAIVAMSPAGGRLTAAAPGSPLRGDRGGSVTPAGTGRPGRPDPRAGVPLPPGREDALPEQSREDTDAGWGEYPERADDRLYRDRPPHWDDF